MNQQHIKIGHSIPGWCVFCVALTLFPATSAAYVGPGAGLGMLGSLIAVVVAVLLATISLIVLPIRMLMKRRKRNTSKDGEEQADNSGHGDN